MNLPPLVGRPQLLLLLALHGRHARGIAEDYANNLAQDIATSRQNVYSAFTGLEKLGLTASRTQEGTCASLGHPPRRYFRLTPRGAAAVGQLLRLAGAEKVPIVWSGALPCRDGREIQSPIQ